MKTTCQEPDVLRAWLLGQVDDDLAASLAEHVADCEDCEQTLSGFDDTADSLVGSLKNVGRQPTSAVLDANREEDALPDIPNPFSPMAPSASSKTTPSRVHERIRDYELMKPLGYGGMGTVYLARHLQLDRIVALKLLPARRLRDPQAVERFRREMKAIGSLHHPSIVRATDAGEADGTLYLAMDLVNGIDLSRLVRLQGPVSAGAACEIIRQAAHALHYAHSQGLVHRDVKPGNLMLEQSTDSNGCTVVTVKVMDLGLALFGAASEAVDDLTTVGQLMGTLDYMAPEQADSSHRVEAAADVYSLGATLFKLLTGSAPYAALNCRTALAKMKALSLQDPPLIRQCCAGLPNDVADLVDSMLQRNPVDRPVSAAAVAERLTLLSTPEELPELLDRALSADQQQRTEELATASLASKPAQLTSTPAVTSAAASQPQAQPAMVPPRSPWRHMTAVAGMAALAVFAAVIWLQTSRGTLKIETAEAGIPVEIVQGQQLVSALTLKTGTNEVQLRSGEYEIRVPVEFDDVVVENNRVEIRRGGQWLARVSRGPLPPKSGTASADPSADEPPSKTRKLTWEGRTFEEWKQNVLTERSPDQLLVAVKALCRLSRRQHDRVAADAILSLLPALNADDVLTASPFTPKLHDAPIEYQLLRHMAWELQTLDAEDVVAATTEVIRSRQENTELFVACCLAAQRNFRSYVERRSAGSGMEQNPAGLRLVRAFDQSGEWTKLLTQQYEQLSEPLKINHWYRLTAPQSGVAPIPVEPVHVQLAQEAIAGRDGARVCMAAWEFIVRRGITDPSLPDRLLEYVLHHPVEQTGRDLLSWDERAPETGITVYSHWGHTRCFCWVLLADRIEQVTRQDLLIAAIRHGSDSVARLVPEAGLLAGETASETSLPSLKPANPGHVQSGGGFFSVSDPMGVGLTRALLATELAARLTSPSPELIDAVRQRVEQLCGQQPVENGGYAYRPLRDHSLIPSIADTLKTSGYPATLLFETQQATELESAVRTLSILTGAPVCFAQEVPELQLNPNACPLVSIDGLGPEECVDPETLPPAENWRSVQHQLQRAETWAKWQTENAEEFRRRCHVLRIHLVTSSLKRPSEQWSDADILRLWELLPAEYADSADWNNMVHLLLESASDGRWQHRVIRHWIARSEPVSGNDVGGVQPTGLVCARLNAPQHATKSTTPRLRRTLPGLEPILIKLCDHAAMDDVVLLDSLMDWMDATDQFTADRRRVLKQFVRDAPLAAKVRAANLLVQRSADVQDVRDVAEPCLLDAVLHAESMTDLLNAAYGLNAVVQRRQPHGLSSDAAFAMLDALENSRDDTGPLHRYSVWGREHSGDAESHLEKVTGRRCIWLRLLLSHGGEQLKQDQTFARLQSLLGSMQNQQQPFREPQENVRVQQRLEELAGQQRYLTPWMPPYSSSMAPAGRFRWTSTEQLTDPTVMDTDVVRVMLEREFKWMAEAKAQEQTEQLVTPD